MRWHVYEYLKANGLDVDLLELSQVAQGDTKELFEGITEYMLAQDKMGGM